MEYKTKILLPTRKNIELAAKEIEKGNLVGMPTETVYGLAANAFCDEAIANIFIAKNRPQDNPLIVHVHKDYDLNRLVKNISPLALKLLKAFTPGPITLIFESKGTVSKRVSCGLDTIAIRIPNHKVCQKFLKACDLPIAAPSANRSKRMSATTASEVKEELDGKMPIILNGGKCQIGVESTVVDVRGDKPIILRPGKITLEMISAVAEGGEEKCLPVEGQKVLSPGQKYKHYSPSCPVLLASLGEEEKLAFEYDTQKAQGKKPVILCLNKNRKLFGHRQKISLGKDVEDYAKNIYSALRKAEKKHDIILLCTISSEGLGSAVMNRVSKIGDNTLL